MELIAQTLMSALESASRTQGEKVTISQDAHASMDDGSAGLSTADGLKLLRAFLNIRDATLRRSVVHLVELLAAPPAKG